MHVEIRSHSAPLRSLIAAALVTGGAYVLPWTPKEGVFPSLGVTVFALLLKGVGPHY